MNRFVNTVIFLLLALSVVKASNFVFTPINVSHGLSDNQIRYISQLPDGRLVFTTSGNLNVYDGAKFKYLHRTPEHVYPLSKYNGFYRIYQDGDSLLWIKDSHKLMCVNLYQDKYIPRLDLYFESRGISQTIEDLFMDSSGDLWILSSGKLKNKNFEVFDIEANKGDLQDLATDKNNLYLFYSSGQVICYDLKTKKELYRKAAYTENEQAFFRNTSLINYSDNGFYQLRNGSKGGFFFFDSRNHTWKKIFETDYTLNTLVVKDSMAYISCATGLWIINCQNGDKEYLPVLKTVDGNIIDTEISTLFYDKQGGLWLGTLNQGLLYHHPARYKFNYIGRTYFPNLSTKDIVIQSFSEDENGNIFIKSNRGIYSYHSSENKNILTPAFLSMLSQKVQEQLSEKLQHLFKGKSYTDVHTDVRGWVWAGTEDGLKLFKPKENKEQTFYTEDGLTNNSIHAILEDRNGNLWITTSYGISNARVDTVNGKIYFINFNTYDGTLDGEYANDAIFEASNGTLFFGGINGFNTFHPEQVSQVGIPFSPVFTNLYLYGNKIEPGKSYEGSVILSRTAPYVKNVELTHKQNFLTLEFSAINYLNPSQTSYRYKLDGIDDDWREVRANADGILQVSYTNLPHGKYTFKVMASSNEQQWDGAVTEIDITIHAPWWKTTEAYIFYTLFSILIVSMSAWLYIYYTRKKIERQHKDEILLLRIRNLIDQNNLLEEEKKFSSSKENTETSITASNNFDAADTAFLTRAMELVEQNLNEVNYSVEILSRDLCMDRTGLYRKLIALLDKSPSLFIRNIRLQKAAQLIQEGELNITEISEKVGFSSSSYMSKCFQEMYGCRPSEYAEKTKKST